MKKVQNETSTPSSKPKPSISKPSRLTTPKKKPDWTRTSYFEERQKKLTSQAPKPITDILKNISVYFTGVKSANQRSLEAVVWRNGGVVQKVWLRKQVTHVVADNLAASKMQHELSGDRARMSSGVIVKPAWIVESVAAGRMLPTWDYQVVRGPPDVKNVARFFKKRRKGAS